MPITLKIIWSIKSIRKRQLTYVIIVHKHHRINTIHFYEYDEYRGMYR